MLGRIIGNSQKKTLLLVLISNTLPLMISTCVRSCTCKSLCLWRFQIPWGHNHSVSETPGRGIIVLFLTTSMTFWDGDPRCSQEVLGNLSSTWPVTENKRSTGQDVSGFVKQRLANRDNVGRDVRVVSTTLKSCPTTWLDWYYWNVPVFIHTSNISALFVELSELTDVRVRITQRHLCFGSQEPVCIKSVMTNHNDESKAK